MVSKQVGAIFTILGGVFYIFGSFAGAFLSAIMSGFAYGFSSYYGQGSNTTLSSMGEAALLVLVFGVMSGVLIIVGGTLINSDSADRRKSGGILAIAMMIIGALPAVGGLLIGFLFTLIGSVIGLTYKGAPDIIIGTMPMSPPPASSSQATSTSGRATTRFCIKCGMALHEGAVYCGACGAPVPQG